MSSIQVSARDGRIPLPLVAGVVAAAFVLGALAGFGLPRIVEGASHTAGAAGALIGIQTVEGVAEHTMSDSAYQALHPAIVQTALAAAVALPDMSAAAYDAFHGPASTTMSAAAYDAFHGPASTTMSAAAYDAFHGPASTTP